MKRKVIYISSIILLAICMVFVALFLIDFYKNKLFSPAYILGAAITGILSQIGLYYNIFTKKK